MKTVSDITAEILRREGGYVNDPDDPGGATNHGVTLATLRRLGLDLDGDGDIDAADVRRLTRDQAAEIFERHYYHGAGIPRLPGPLRASVYDMNVNAGSIAVRLLQRLLGAFGEVLVEDGKLGPATAAAAFRVQTSTSGALVDAYGIARRNYYYALAEARPALRKFARRRDGGKGGWITRAEEFIAPRFHLSDAEHKARVRTWA
ncbi:holin-associated N-acetylmuramidase [Defluviimonas sp. D31]|uniref:holin-associated N-acetylmuramidase n=1 Tax=Defluviimonas sp. D31 TaxID=3083253 RepID=UPI00296F7165|nr:holin-associated N-acetylmuramidase [Defluviimonas sp. D31]MDW4550893.1 holin-associated N-acetylmuramidase [Defluviimonas sp. D31]